MQLPELFRSPRALYGRLIFSQELGTVQGGQQVKDLDRVVGRGILSRVRSHQLLPLASDRTACYFLR